MCSRFVYDNEISQVENSNATARLWIQPDHTVYKQYVVRNEVTEQNITNLLLMAEHKKAWKISEIVFPLEIVKDSGAVLGYTMLYINGRTIDKYQSDRKVPRNSQLGVLLKVAKVIDALPKGVYIGDLHGNNILVDDNENIHIIDVDGFSLDKGYKISCPAEFWLLSSARQNKKYWKGGRFVISKDSDILCWYMLFVTWLMGASPLMYTENEVQNYFSYLKSVGFSISILDDISRLSSKRHNIINIAHINELSEKELSRFSYHEYRESTMKKFMV